MDSQRTPDLLEQIENLVRPLVEGSGFTLYDVEFVGRTLRVYIEKPGTSVSIDDCVETSRLLNPVLDVEDLIPGGSYDLEVSSPGLDRALRRPEHFAAALGERIHVTTREPLSLWNGSEPFFEKRRNVQGMLREFDGTNLKLLAEGERVVVIPRDAVTKAYIDFEIKTTPKKGKN